MEYCLDETTVSRYVQFGVNVFGIDADQEPMAIAKQSIQALSDFFYHTLGLKQTFTEVGIDDQHFEVMAQKSLSGGLAHAFKPLTAEDVVAIFKMCL